MTIAHFWNTLKIKDNQQHLSYWYMRLNIEQLSWTKSKCNSWTEVKRVFNVFY